MNLAPKIFHSNGKLLLTGEYFVLDGAQALALPTKLGQSLQVVENESNEINWVSYDKDHSIWFQGKFHLPSGELQIGTDQSIGGRLTQIFLAIQKQKPAFFQQFRGLQMETRLDFPRQWGLGTSSTLIANLAQWAGIDPFQLLKNTFGGSGYDIACAMAKQSIIYQLIDNQAIYKEILYAPLFVNNIYFIYLGKKQDSRQGIVHYREKVKSQSTLISRISELTKQFIDCQNLIEFENLIRQHEAIVSETLQLPRAKSLYFSDYWGEIKSLGAWGGDFILATTNKTAAETKFYFNEKGFETVIPYEKLIL
ncbi:MAG: GYDIA family GHMP kinase [Saprospiraceae bacterium]|nr:GYDIA family GHMP kinase [Saprospiraceae bacterium]